MSPTRDRARLALEAFAASLTRVHQRVPRLVTPEHDLIRVAATRVRDLPDVTRDSLTTLLRAGRSVDPTIRRVYGLAVGLSQERLANEMGADLTEEERRDAARVVQFLDDAYGLVAEVASARAQSYSWADILVARASGRASAGRAISGGRGLEDAVEAIVHDLRLPFVLRTQFVGLRNDVAPCDVAIPDAGSAAQIVCAVKGFDSTGSKLTDAVREIGDMARVRRATQFVCAVVDGIGWRRRAADLARVHGFYERREIDGLYSRAMLDAFRTDVDRAATVMGIPRQRKTRN